MKHLIVRHRPFQEKVGLGTALKRAIRTAVDAAPLSAEAKAKIKNCGGCGKRAAALDRLAPNINPLAAPSLPPEDKSTTPSP